MTDTTTEDPISGGAAEVEPVADAAPVVVHEAPRSDSLQTRLLIPLLLPILVMVAVALYALNISRVFLAGDSTSALVVATIITLAILIGGALVSATPGARTSSLAMLMTVVFVIVLSAGLLALGPSLDTGVSGGSSQLAQPKGDAIATVAVEALASIRYNASNYDAPAGIVEFDITGATGHSFQFRKLDYKDFPIGTSSPFPKSGKVELKPGTYDVYCTIDGHAAQGMVATITVTDAPPPSS